MIFKCEGIDTKYIWYDSKSNRSWTAVAKVDLTRCTTEADYYFYRVALQSVGRSGLLDSWMAWGDENCNHSFSHVGGFMYFENEVDAIYFALSHNV